MKKIILRSKIKNIGEAERSIIAGLVLNKDWNWRLPDGTAAYPEAIKRLAERNRRDFFIKLGKALYEGKHRKNALIENFVALNWNEAHYQQDSPPLKNFTPSAAIELLRIKFDREMTEDAYCKVIRRMGLRLKKRATVRVCRQSHGAIVTK